MDEGDQKTNVISKREDILCFQFNLYCFLRDHRFDYALGLLVSSAKGLILILNQFVLQVELKFPVK